MPRAPYTKPLSMKPDAIRQRKRKAKLVLEREAAKLGGIAEASEVKPARVVPDPANATNSGASSIPIHTTKTVNVGGPDRFMAIPSIQASDGSPRPIVASGEESSGPSDSGEPSGSASTSADPGSGAPTPQASQPAASTITPEEAKMFAKALGAYFAFGSAMLLNKHPEFAGGLVQINGGDVAEFRKNFLIAQKLVEGCGERVAIKYNLRIPYLDEAVVLTAIGVASYGLAGKPSELGAKQMKAAEEQARAQQARNANPQPQPQPQTASQDSAVKNGRATQAPPDDVYAPQPIASSGATVLDGAGTS